MNEPLFQRVEAHQVPLFWGFVERGLADVIRHCPTVPWTPRDVRRWLRKADAALYVRDEGFVILQRCNEAVTHEPYLNVWVMWFEPGAAEVIRDQLIEWLDYSCKATFCEWWEFSSTREAWGRALENDCDVAMLTWRRRP